MELKPVNDNYEKPECPTDTEVKLNLWRLLGRGGKISLACAIIFLLCAGTFDYITNELAVQGGLTYIDIGGETSIEETDNTKSDDNKGTFSKATQEYKTTKSDNNGSITKTYQNYQATTSGSSFSSLIDQNNYKSTTSPSININLGMIVYNLLPWSGFWISLILTVFFSSKNYRKYKIKKQTEN